ncbi:GNAT family N-acetyltransferase [Acinetobacter boissieri]|uniref:Protein N-acetyltransferase, RimJ/RimL family n=1 Tax=Acinetobacter boissieri TaxID=1219383 RepID=A0A1G6HFT5_9GAMM|nr:GNAT family N-acetyltransferase [Acinetobacter boissieri]SDB93024.1 Protein N-acetyltransferase, RimJ/RimL family [Acinetobacter boissieri]
MKQIHVFTLHVEDAEKTFQPLKNKEIYHFISDIQYSHINELKKRYQCLVGGSLNNNERWLNWIVYQDDKKTVPVGTIQATILKDEQKAYVGYVMFKEFWNQGYGTAALNWLIQFLIENINIKSLEASVDMCNMYSIRLLEKFLFERVGTDGGDFIYRRDL